MRTGSLFLLVIVLIGCRASSVPHQSVVLKDGAVRIPRTEVSDGQVHFYRFDGEDGRVDFLIRTDGSGALHVHLDACYSCYRYGEGFYVEGGNVVCRACRYKYAVSDLEWDYIGGCAPIPLRFDLDDSSVIVSNRALKRAARFF